MRSLALTSLLSIVALASGCSRSSEAQQKPDAASTAVAAPSSAPAVASAPSPVADMDASAEPEITVKNLNDPRFAMLSILSKLAVEKQNRPAEALKAEAVFDAVTAKVGKPLVNRSQLAGFPVVAGYCEKADTELAVNVVVCEYHDAAALAKGKALALKNDVKRREFVTAKQSWVSITRFNESKDAADQAKQIAELVKKL